jgi:hypothetical protein
VLGNHTSRLLDLVAQLTTPRLPSESHFAGDLCIGQSKQILTPVRPFEAPFSYPERRLDFKFGGGDRATLL